MSNLIFDISLSLDGYVAGPNPSNEEPLGYGGELLHEWAFNTRYSAPATAARAVRTTSTRAWSRRFEGASAPR
jgi:hypothetical protein